MLAERARAGIDDVERLVSVDVEDLALDRPARAVLLRARIVIDERNRGHLGGSVRPKLGQGQP